MFMVEFFNGVFEIFRIDDRGSSSRPTLTHLSTIQSGSPSFEQREMISRQSSRSREVQNLRNNSFSRSIESSSVRYDARSGKVSIPNSPMETMDAHSDLILSVDYFLRHGAEYPEKNMSPLEGSETSPSMTTFMGSTCGLNRDRGRCALTDSEVSIEGNILVGKICICEYIKLVKQRISANRESSKDRISTICQDNNGESRHLLTILHKEVTKDHENVVVATAFYKDSEDVCARIVITLKDNLNRIADEACRPVAGNEGSMIAQSLIPSEIKENAERDVCDRINEKGSDERFKRLAMEENEARRKERIRAWLRSHHQQKEISFIDAIEEEDENITPNTGDEVEEQRREASVRPKRND